MKKTLPLLLLAALAASVALADDKPKTDEKPKTEQKPKAEAKSNSGEKAKACTLSGLPDSGRPGLPVVRSQTAAGPSRAPTRSEALSGAKARAQT